MTAETTASANSASENGRSSNGTPRTKFCVYCGASGGTSPAHLEAARELATVMAENEIDLGKFSKTENEKKEEKGCFARTRCHDSSHQLKTRH